MAELAIRDDELPFPLATSYDEETGELTVTIDAHEYDPDEFYVRSSPEHVVVNVNTINEGCVHPPYGRSVDEVTSVELRNGVLTIKAETAPTAELADPRATETDHEITVADTA